MILSTQKAATNLKVVSMKLSSFCCLSLLFLLFSSCQSLTLNSGDKIEEQETLNGLQYSILAFPAAMPLEKFPLMIVLHGRGENRDIYMNYLAEEAAHRRVMLVSLSWEDWNLKAKKTTKGSVGDLDAAVNEILQKYPAADPNRLTLMGISAGALVARWLVQIDPAKWKSVVLVAYSTQETWWESLKPGKSPAVLFVHGKKDDQFSSDAVEFGVSHLQKNGIRVDWIEDPEAGHEYRPEWTEKILDWIEKKPR